MKIIEVQEPKTIRAFLRLPDSINQGDPNYVKPLDHEINNVFNPKTNKHFRHGEAIRWILEDDKGITIGRIAAFIDHKISHTHEQPTGSVGFFECIDDQEAANLLFQTAKEWLSIRGMEAMDGPVNFGDRDKWWGLLTEGFYPPNFGMPYNPPYYQKLFENYGFRNYFNQYTFHRNIFDGDVDDHMRITAERIAANPSYEIKHIRKKNLDQYAKEFMEVYNHAWTRHSGVKNITIAHARALLKNIKPIIDERLVWFAYFEGRPVGFFIMIPELNKVFKHMNGKFRAWEKLKFFWYFKIRKVSNKAIGIIFGIVTEHQRKGLEGAIVNAFREVAISGSFPYKELELNWIGDFNPTMIRIAEMVGCKIKKTHVTYRYLFDSTKPFTRARKVS